MPNPTSKLNLVINGTTTQLDIHDANAVDLTSNQTVGGNKEFTGTTTAHDLVPSATDTYDFGSSSYQWNNAYIKSLTINGVACGDILTHNASEFVGVTGAQTIAGVKTFSKIALKSSRIERGSLPSSNITEDSEIEIVDKNNRRILGIFNYYYANGNGRTSFYAYNPNTTDYDNIAIAFDFDNANNQKSLLPVGSNAVNLGTSTNKWKSFNGINPGALSLPGNYINVDTTNWVLDGTPNHFVPTSDGWLGIQAIDTVYDQMHYVFVGRNDSASYYQQNVLSPINALWDGEYHGCIFIPVVKNSNYDIRCICSSIVATFYPCQGNV